MGYTKRFTDIKCGDWGCDREAKWVPVGDIPTDRLASAPRCGIHGPGYEKRRRYGTPIEYAPIETRPDVQQAARDAVAEAARAEEARRKASQDAHHQKLRASSVYYWDQHDKEEDYVLVYYEDAGYSGTGPIAHRWSAFGALLVAKAQAEGVPVHRMGSPAFTVEVKEDRTFDDVVTPVAVRTTNSNYLTPKLVPFLTDALQQAATLATGMNVRLRELHKRQAENYNLPERAKE